MEAISVTEQMLRSRLFCKALKSTQVSSDTNGLNTNMTPDLLVHLLDTIAKLEKCVQFAEFTDYGLPHLLSLTKRVSNWTIIDGTHLVDILSPDEALYLCLGIILHDAGMLSQVELDLQDADRFAYSPQFTDIQTWVRNTHVKRIRGLFSRILSENNSLSFICDSSLLELVVTLAETHHEWPDINNIPYFDYLVECSNAVNADPARIKALAGILAVVDLLDEDYSRLDAKTMLEHKSVTSLNRSHWLRHYLVRSAPIIKNGMANIDLAEIPAWRGKIDASMVAMHNHLAMVNRYNPCLATINASINLNINRANPWSENPFKTDNDQIAYFNLAPDIHLLRAFSRGLVRTDPSSAFPCLAIYTDQSTAQRELFLSEQPPDIPDSILTLRAVRQFDANPALIERAMNILKWDARIERQRGNIDLANQLMSEVRND